MSVYLGPSWTLNSVDVQSNSHDRMQVQVAWGGGGAGTYFPGSRGLTGLTDVLS